jgi:hypothetical protein
VADNGSATRPGASRPIDAACAHDRIGFRRLDGDACHEGTSPYGQDQQLFQHHRIAPFAYLPVSIVGRFVNPDKCDFRPNQ